MSTYSEKLKDPRWQKVRLKVLERAGWRCEACGESTKTLHVHHGYYEKNCDPWEYDDQTLWSLYWECHEQATVALRDVYWEIAHLNPRRLSPWAIQDIIRTEEDAMESLRRGDKHRGSLPSLPSEGAPN